MFKSLLYPFRALLRRNQLEQSMKDEMQLHIELQAQEYEQAGLSKAEALRKAKRAFGNQTSIEEACRASWGVRLWDEFTNDIHSAVLQIRKHPLFSTVAILSLAIGMGVNLALCSTYNSILLKPVAIDHAEQLREIQWQGPAVNGSSSGRRILQPDGTYIYTIVSQPLFESFRQSVSSLADVFCWVYTYSLTVDFGNQKRDCSGILISDNYFSVLHVKPIRGRIQLDADDNPERSVWINENVWNRDFARDPDIIGRSLLVKNESFTILGVIPSTFESPEKGSRYELLFPMQSQPFLASFYAFQNDPHKSFWIRSALRLKHPDFEGDVKAILEETLRSANIPFNSTTDSIIPQIWLKDLSRGVQLNNTAQTKALKLPMILSAMLLLVSCINLAGLQISHNFRRTHELRIRAALGASRGRLIRQLLVETSLLCILGSITGILLAIFAHQLIAGQFVYGIEAMNNAPDLRILLFWAAVISLCVVLIGLYPAIRVTRPGESLTINFKAENSSQNLIFGKVSITAQIICTLVLIYGSFLFGKTLSNLYHTDPGFDTEHLLLFSLKGDDSLTKSETASLIPEKIRAVIDKIPGVISVAYANMLLLANGTQSTWIEPKDFPSPTDQKVSIYTIITSPHFFQTLKIPILAGNDFDDQLLEVNQNKILISEALAQKAFPEGNPIGKTLVLHDKTREIIGVCAPIRYYSLRKASENIVYFPANAGANHPMAFRDCQFYVRTETNPLSFVNTIRKEITDENPGLYINYVQSMDDNIQNLVQSEKSISILTIVFSTITMLLTSIGLFALVSNDIGARNQEIGIRLALGAKRKSIVRWIVGRTLFPLIPGCIIGIPLALFLKHSIEKMLFNIGAYEPLGILFSVAVVVATTLLAVLCPSIRASRSDPSKILRNDG